MRYILGIDTASPHGSVALAEDGVPVSVEPLLPGEHSSGLSSAASKLLSGRGIDFGDLSALAVSRGPGSFTGLRIGLAWAKGVALGKSLSLLMVSPHEAAAYAHRFRAPMIATLIPAERGKVETAVWRSEEKDGAPLVWGPVQVEEDLAVEAILAAVSPHQSGNPAWGVALAPSTAKLAAAIEELAEGVAGVTVLPPEPLGASVAAIGDRLFLAGDLSDLITASPEYGRAPNARKPSP